MLSAGETDVNRRADSDRTVDPDAATDLVNGSLAGGKTDPQADPFPRRLPGSRYKRHGRNVADGVLCEVARGSTEEDLADLGRRIGR